MKRWLSALEYLLLSRVLSELGYQQNPPRELPRMLDCGFLAPSLSSKEVCRGREVLCSLPVRYSYGGVTRSYCG